MLGNKFNGYQNGRRRYFLDMGGDVEAPDYTPIANANAAAAANAKEVADKDIAFREKVYNENKPYIEAAQKAGLDASTAQVGIMKDAADRSAQQWDRYTNTFIPVENQMVKEAMDYGSQSDQDMQAGRAIADVRTQGGIAQENVSRNLASMGVNPNSGRFASGLRRVGIEEAATAAGAGNNARVTARDKGIGLRAGAASFGRNMTNTAGQMAGVSSNAGTAGAATAGMAAGAALPSASFATGGTANGMNAAGMTINSNMGIAGLQRDAYNTSVNQNAAGMNAVGNLVGTGLMLL